MNRDFIKSLCPYTEQEISIWEEEFNIVLPSDYRAFLIAFGKSGTNGFILFNADKIGKTFWPYTWCGLDDIDKESLINYFNHDSKKMFYPFGYDGGGAYAYISLKENDFGSIYISNWDDYDEEKEEYQKFKVADSFTDFINGLQTEEEAGL